MNKLRNGYYFIVCAAAVAGWVLTAGRASVLARTPGPAKIGPESIVHRATNASQRNSMCPSPNEFFKELCGIGAKGRASVAPSATRSDFQPQSSCAPGKERLIGKIVSIKVRRHNRQLILLKEDALTIGNGVCS